MSYTISEAAEKTGLPPSTIRFYDKEGLLPNIKRKNGIRVFEDMDLRLMGLDGASDLPEKHGHAHQAHP